MKNFVVYILASKKNGTLYIGVTSDIVKRVYEHKYELVEGFTKDYNVKNLVYLEQHATAEAAIMREKQLKKWNRSWKIKLIQKVNPNWHDLYEQITLDDKCKMDPRLRGDDDDLISCQRGSVFVYIFLAIAIFAALSYVVANMMRSGGDSGGVEKARLNAQSLIDYAQKAKITVQDMKLNGIDAATLSFLKSGDAGYTTAPHTAKVFHPDGGGLPVPNFNDLLETSVTSPIAGIYMGRNAIDDVGSSVDEVILSVRGVQKTVCEQVNQYVVGSTTVPSTGATNHDNIFRTGSVDLTAALCASCAGKTIYCVSQTTPTLYTFYAVIDPN